jgi:hypothetical protein
MNDKKNEDLTLEAQLGQDDWAIIIGQDGNLKGLFIPEGKDEDLVPESIIKIMSTYFSVDFEEEVDDTSNVPPGETLH